MYGYNQEIDRIEVLLRLYKKEQITLEEFKKLSEVQIKVEYIDPPVSEPPYKITYTRS